MQLIQHRKILLPIAIITLLLILALSALLVYAYLSNQTQSSSSNNANNSNPVSNPVVNSDAYSIDTQHVADKKISSINLSLDNFPVIDGATSTQPLRALIACKALNLDCHWREMPDREMFIYYYSPTINAEKLASLDKKIVNSKTHDAYLNLINKKLDLILVSTKPSDDEVAVALKQNVKLEVTSIGLDGFIFLVNGTNSITNLKTSDVVDIYTGKVTNWQAYTGENKIIAPYVRQKNSGSQELMEKLVMKGTAMKEFPAEQLIASMEQLVFGVDTHPNAIGYSLYYYKNTMLDKGSVPTDVKILSIDGVAPTPESISSKQYPHTFNVYAVTRTDLDHTSREYQIKQWLTSDEGQDLIAQAGYVKLYTK